MSSNTPQPSLINVAASPKGIDNPLLRRPVLYFNSAIDSATDAQPTCPVSLKVTALTGINVNFDVQ